MKAAVITPIIIILIIAASAAYLYLRAPEDFGSTGPESIQMNQKNPDKIEVNDTTVIDKNLVVGSESALIK